MSISFIADAVMRPVATCGASEPTCCVFFHIVIMICISCASDVRVHVPSSLLRVRRVGTDVLCCLSCDHELFFLCVCRGQVHVQFVWLD